MDQPATHWLHVPPAESHIRDLSDRNQAARNASIAAVGRQALSVSAPPPAPPAAYLTGKSIETLCKRDPPLIDKPAPATKFDGWSYDMRLGTEVFLSSEKEVRDLGSNGAFFLQPGDFALLTTEEALNIPPNIVAFITLRFSVALKGLVNVSGFHVDPGFSGKIVFSVYNAGPNAVALRQGEPTFMVCFAYLEDKVSPQSREHAIFKKTERLKAEWISAAKGPSVSLVKLNRKVEALESRLNTVLEVLIVIVATVLGGLLLAYIYGVKP